MLCYAKLHEMACQMHYCLDIFYLLIELYTALFKDIFNFNAIFNFLIYYVQFDDS